MICPSKSRFLSLNKYFQSVTSIDLLCGLVVRVPGYKSRGAGSIPGANRFSEKGLERGRPSLVSTIKELLERKK
jgi:hypothetical protein